MKAHTTCKSAIKIEIRLWAFRLKEIKEDLVRIKKWNWNKNVNIFLFIKNLWFLWKCEFLWNSKYYCFVQNYAFPDSEINQIKFLDYQEES